MQIVESSGTHKHIKSENVQVNLNSTAEILAVFPHLNVEAVSKQCEGTIEMRNQVVIKKCKWQRWMQDASYIGMLKFESLGQDVSRRLYTRNDEMMLTGWAIHWDTLFALITLTPNRPHFYFCDATVDHTFCIPFISTFTLTRGMLRWNRSKLSSRSTDSKSPSNLAESAWSLKMNIPFNLRATSPITTRWTQDFRACTSLCHQQCEWKKLVSK